MEAYQAPLRQVIENERRRIAQIGGTAEGGAAKEQTASGDKPWGEIEDAG